MGQFNCRNCHCNKDVDEEFEEQFNQKKEETTILEPNINKLKNINENNCNEKNLNQNNYIQKINDNINKIEVTNITNNINVETNNNYDDILLNNKNNLNSVKIKNNELFNNNMITIESISQSTNIN